MASRIRRISAPAEPYSARILLRAACRTPFSIFTAGTHPPRFIGPLRVGWSVKSRSYFPDPRPSQWPPVRAFTFRRPGSSSLAHLSISKIGNYCREVDCGCLVGDLYCPCSRQVASTKPRSQRCAGSASKRGCHICETVIASVRTGSGKLLTTAGPDLV
jgi:hypothetical protein